jgi:peroxiredoxin
VLLAALSCAGEPPRGGPAPAFDLERLGGGRVTLEGLRGRWVLIDFWATWCAPCVVEIPELNEFYAEHRASGVELLAIAVDGDDPDALAAFAREHAIGYPVAVGSEELARQYGALAFPYHVLVSPEGDVRARLEPGFHTREELRDLLAAHR